MKSSTDVSKEMTHALQHSTGILSSDDHHEDLSDHKQHPLLYKQLQTTSTQQSCNTVESCTVSPANPNELVHHVCSNSMNIFYKYISTEYSYTVYLNIV